MLGGIRRALAAIGQEQHLRADHYALAGALDNDQGTLSAVLQERPDYVDRHFSKLR